jgi:hypothetical protein
VVAVPRDAPRLVQLFCNKRIPPSEGLKLEVEPCGNDMTIVERRPPWRPEAGSEWSSLPVAKLHWDPRARLWSLRCPDSNGRWHRYDEIAPSPDLGSRLVEIDPRSRRHLLGLTPELRSRYTRAGMRCLRAGGPQAGSLGRRRSPG